MFLTTHHSTADTIELLGWVIVVGCLLGAAYMAYLRNALAVGLLIIVAIFAAFLML